MSEPRKPLIDAVLDWLRAHNDWTLIILAFLALTTIGTSFHNFGVDARISDPQQEIERLK